jgi:hypothetical protein
MKHLLLSLALILSANAWADKSILTCTHADEYPEKLPNSYLKEIEHTNVFEIDLETQKIKFIKSGPKGKETNTSWVDKKGNPMSRDIHYIWKQIYIIYGDSTEGREAKEITEYDTQRTNISVLDLENNVFIRYPLMQDLLDHKNITLAFIDGIDVYKCTRIDL